MKKPKSLETKLRSAIRLIWSRSTERRAILKAALYKDPTTGNWMFRCAICHTEWHQAMGEVDHIVPVGSLELDRITEFVRRMFYSPQQVIDKLCHKRKTAEQRRKNGYQN